MLLLYRSTGHPVGHNYYSYRSSGHPVTHLFLLQTQRHPLRHTPYVPKTKTPCMKHPIAAPEAPCRLHQRVLQVIGHGHPVGCTCYSYEPQAPCTTLSPPIHCSKSLPVSLSLVTVGRGSIILLKATEYFSHIWGYSTTHSATLGQKY